MALKTDGSAAASTYHNPDDPDRSEDDGNAVSDSESRAPSPAPAAKTGSPLLSGETIILDVDRPWTAFESEVAHEAIVKALRVAAGQSLDKHDIMLRGFEEVIARARQGL